jgi:hypothetical protein
MSDPNGLTCCSTESKKFSEDGNNKEKPMPVSPRKRLGWKQ